MTIRTATAVFAFALAADSLSADVVTDWNQAALEAIQVDRTSPPRAARNLAILPEEMPGVVRSFSSFSAAAMEASLSRLYGGIHFRSGNEAGLSSGRLLGAWVAANFLGDRPGNKQRGK